MGHRLYEIYLCGLYLRLFDYTCEDPVYLQLTAVWINPQRKGTEPLSLSLPHLRTNQPVPTLYMNVFWPFNQLNKFILYYFYNHCVFHWLILIPKRGSFDPNLKRGIFDQNKYLHTCDVTQATLNFEKYFFGGINYPGFSGYLRAFQIHKNHFWKNNPYHQKATLNFWKYILNKKNYRHFSGAWISENTFRL